MNNKFNDSNNSGLHNLEFSDLSSMIENSIFKEKKSFYARNFEKAIIKSKELIGISFENCYTRRVLFENCIFQKGEFWKGIFNYGTMFSGCSFKQCNFHELEFRQCNLENVSFFECSHFETYFDKCQLKNVSFNGGTCESFLFRECNYTELTVTDVEVTPRPNVKNGLNGTAWYFDERPDADTLKALSLLGVIAKYKER